MPSFSKRFRIPAIDGRTPGYQAISASLMTEGRTAHPGFFRPATPSPEKAPDPPSPARSDPKGKTWFRQKQPSLGFPHDPPGEILLLHAEY